MLIDYKHRPPATGLHAKLAREARAAAATKYEVQSDMSGRPGHVRVFHCELMVWQGHRDSMPSEYRGARDPFGVIDPPDSSD